MGIRKIVGKISVRERFIPPEYSTRPSGAEDPRVQVIDLVRTCAILVVLTAHFFLAAPDLGVLSGSFACRAMAHLFSSGRYGVTLFFVVSGFLITRVIADRMGGLFRLKIREFYARRCGRILPLFLGALALGALGRILLAGTGGPRLAHSFGTGPEVLSPLFWASLVTFQFNWYRVFRGVHGLHWEVLWSLSIEEQFYLFYPPLLLLLGNRKKLIRAMIGLIFFAVLFRVATLRHVNPAVYSSFGNFDAIAWGVLLFIVSRDLEGYLKRRPGFCRWLALGGAALLTLSLVLTNPYGDKNIGSTLVGGMLFLFLLGALPLELFQGRVFRLLFLPGRLSYGCYLLHPAVLYLLWPALSGKTWIVAYLLFIAGVVAAAWVSFVGFETPLNRVFRRGFLRLWPEKTGEAARS